VLARPVNVRPEANLRLGDPGTRDSTPEHKRGSVLYLVAEVVDPNPNGCWGTKRSKLAYSGAKGLDFRRFGL
jgi:hypothetical protein